MFGYLKLDKNCPKELQVEYKKYYCFLCRSLQKHYGFISRFFLSFDVAFFLILCADESFLTDIEKVHCVKSTGNLNKLLDTTVSQKIATLNMQLMAAKLKDDIVDENDIKAKLAMFLFKRKIAKAIKNCPDMWKLIDEKYEQLRKLEKTNADLETLEKQFSQMMEEIAVKCFELEDVDRRALLISGTKWIYFVDAVDDLDKDIREGTFNPLKHFESFENLAKTNYKFISNHFHSLFSKSIILEGGKNAAILNRLMHVRLTECLINVVTK